MDKNNPEEQAFLEQYDSSRYEKPSVTADIVVFALDEKDRLNLLLIKRGGHPYKDCWALPGGFMNAGKESIDEAAERELFEETGIKDVFIKQLYTFGAVDRDPRMHVISVAYTALIPKGIFPFHAGDDAKEAQLFTVGYDLDGLVLKGEDISLTESQLAFDHAQIIKMAIARLRNRISYEFDAFYLLRDRHDFSILELKKVHEAVKNISLNTANFGRWFLREYITTGYAKAKPLKREGTGKKPATVYSYQRDMKEDMR